MDSDSSLASLALILSLLTFVGVTLSAAAFWRVCAEGDRARVAAATRRMVSRRTQFTGLLPRLGLVSVIATVVSTMALALSLANSSWLMVAGALILILALLGLLTLTLRGIGERFARQVLRVTSPTLVGVEWVSRPILRLLDEWALPAALLDDGRVRVANGGQVSMEIESGGGTSLMQQAMEADERERRMIRAILRLEDITAREVMVPRVDIVAAEASTPLAEVPDLMSEGGHSRFPIYEDTIDKIVSIVHARDLLRHMSLGPASATLTLRDIARPAVFIPESKPLDELLREFQERRVTIAVVVDEYGGTEGLITMEDLLEEIVGEIEDEFETEEPGVVRVSENEVIVDARVNLEELNELLHSSLEGDGFDTLGGLLYDQFGKIPEVGDELTLDGLRMRVLSTAGRRIRNVRILLHH